MTDDATRAAAAPKLTSSGISRLITVLVSFVVVAGVFFVGAGTLKAPRAWLYYGGTFAYELIALIALFLFFPGAIEVINERGKPFKKDVKKWDKVFGVSYAVLLLVMPALAGLDGVRFHWSTAPAFLAVPGLVVTIVAYMFMHWAMIVNKYAETGVRIQEDRHHEVVYSGPYRFVRHPFYVSLILTYLVYPLAVGSLYAFVPAFLLVVLLVWRTAREDATLRRELDGYEAYAAHTRYRLVPFVW
jgi:protein-S-isoprenylcysteine O-methyltransferase Ste14